MEEESIEDDLGVKKMKRLMNGPDRRGCRSSSIIVHSGDVGGGHSV